MPDYALSPLENLHGNGPGLLGIVAVRGPLPLPIPYDALFVDAAGAQTVPVASQGGGGLDYLYALPAGTILLRLSGALPTGLVAVDGMNRTYGLAPYTPSAVTQTGGRQVIAHDMHELIDLHFYDDAGTPVDGSYEITPLVNPEGQWRIVDLQDKPALLDAGWRLPTQAEYDTNAANWRKAYEEAYGPERSSREPLPPFLVRERPRCQ